MRGHREFIYRATEIWQFFSTDSFLPSKIGFAGSGLWTYNCISTQSRRLKSRREVSETGGLAARSHRARTCLYAGRGFSSVSPRCAVQRRACKRSALHAELLVRNGLRILYSVAPARTDSSWREDQRGPQREKGN